MGKQTKARRIAELETQLTLAEEARRISEDVARSADAEVRRYKSEERRQEAIAAKKRSDEAREAERKRLDDLSHGIVDLGKISHDVGFDYDEGDNGGTVTITLRAKAGEVRALNAYVTRGRGLAAGGVVTTPDLSWVDKLTRYGLNYFGL